MISTPTTDSPDRSRPIDATAVLRSSSRRGSSTAGGDGADRMQVVRQNSKAVQTGTSTRNLSQRRVARLLPAGSPQWALLTVMREVRTPSWTPLSSAVRVANQVGDGRALREARARLRLASIERASLAELRALATLNLAISHSEAANPDNRRERIPASIRPDPGEPPPAHPNRPSGGGPTGEQVEP